MGVRRYAFCTIIIASSKRKVNINIEWLPLPQLYAGFSELIHPNDRKVSDNFSRPIFLLPMCQSRHTSPSLGQFLFYRRVRTVTRLHAEVILINIICATHYFCNKKFLQNFRRGNTPPQRHTASPMTDFSVVCQPSAPSSVNHRISAASLSCCLTALNVQAHDLRLRRSQRASDL